MYYVFILFSKPEYVYINLVVVLFQSKYFLNISYAAMLDTPYHNICPISNAMRLHIFDEKHLV